MFKFIKREGRLTLEMTIPEVRDLKEMASKALSTASGALNKASVRIRTTGHEFQVPVGEIKGRLFHFSIKVAGVTFENRQEILKTLPIKKDVKLVPMVTSDYPHRIGVVIDGKGVGWLPDKYAECVHQEKIALAVAGYYKTGGVAGKYPNTGLTLRLIRQG